MKMQHHPGSRTPAVMDSHLFHGEEQRVAVSREAASFAVDTCMVAAAVTGASLLAWWSVAFHPSNSRLWMVPVGLVLACTPAVVCVALTLSAEPRVQEAGAKTAPLSTVVVALTLSAEPRVQEAGAKTAPLSAVVVEM